MTEHLYDLSFWLSLAPALIGNRLDAALWLVTAQGKARLHREVSTDVVRWWGSNGKTPSLRDVATLDQVRALDSTVALFVDGRLYLEQVSRYMPIMSASDPAEVCLQRSVQAARQVHDSLKKQNYLLWDRSHREVPDQPWRWVLIHVLPRITTDADVVAAVRGVVLLHREQTAEMTNRLAELDLRIASLILSLAAP